MGNKITVTIDGREVFADPGKTILECARDNGILSPPFVIILKQQTSALAGFVLWNWKTPGRLSLLVACRLSS